MTKLIQNRRHGAAIFFGGWLFIIAVLWGLIDVAYPLYKGTTDWPFARISMAKKAFFSFVLGGALGLTINHLLDEAWVNRLGNWGRRSRLDWFGLLRGFKV